MTRASSVSPVFLWSELAGGCCGLATPTIAPPNLRGWYGSLAKNLTAESSFPAAGWETKGTDVRFPGVSPYPSAAGGVGTNANKTRQQPHFEKGASMRLVCLFISPTMLVLIGFVEVQAGEKIVLAGGTPPLTEDMVDDYAKFAEWQGITPAQLGGMNRIRQLA